MTAPQTIPANERGRVRVFALSLTDAEARTLSQTPEAIAEALGVDGLLDMEHVELFPISDLEGVGLAGYLTEGAGVPDAQLAADRAKLDKIGGWVLIVFSLAFGDRAATLRPAAPLTLIGTYGETRTDWNAPHEIPSEAAKPYSAPAERGKKRPSNAAMSGRVATLVLLLLAVFTYVFIRIAG